MLQPINQTTPTLHQPLHSKVSNYLNNQRRTGQFCDLILELENSEETLTMHFCVVAAQSGFIGGTHFLQKSLQFTIHNPLKVTIKNFACTQCFHTIVDFFYEDIVSISKEHEPHFRKLAKMLAVTELMNLFQIAHDDDEERAVVTEQANETNTTLATSMTTTTTIGTAEQAKIHSVEDIFDNQQNYFKLKNPRASLSSSSKINCCIACDFKCYPVQKMIAHMSSCEPSHLTCSLCEVGFLGWREYDAHLRKHSSDLRKPFFCLECDARFMTRAALMVHQPKHSTETPHICSHCGKGFKWKQGLSNHMLIHSNQKLMLCDVCGYSTTHMKALKSHKLQHTGEYFKCTVPGCKHRSNRKENMKLHIETHKQERDFICEVCGCKFSQSKNLKRHALKHTQNGQKRYKCQLCGFFSHRSDKIKEHTQRVHTEKAMQLELPEIVESSFENKIEDDFLLPMIDVTKSDGTHTGKAKGDGGCDDGSLVSQSVVKNVKKSKDPKTTKPYEKRLRLLLPKEAPGIK